MRPQTFALLTGLVVVFAGAVAVLVSSVRLLRRTRDTARALSDGRAGLGSALSEMNAEVGRANEGLERLRRRRERRG